MELTKPHSAIVGISLAALLLAAMDSTVLSTILGTMQKDLGGSTAAAWLVSGFILAQTVAAPLFGRMADAFGLKVAFTWTILLFGSGSGLIAGMGRLPMAILARIIQGLGAGGIVILVYTIVAAHSGPEDRPRRQGMVSGIWGLAAILGPLAGTMAAMTVGWRWVFLLNLPVCAVVLILLWARCPSTVHVKGEPGFATLDLLLLSSMVTSLLLSISPASTGLPSIFLLGCAATAASLGITLFLRLRRSALAEAGLRIQPHWAPALVATCCAAYVLYGSVTFLPQFLKNVMHQSIAIGSAAVLAGSLGWVVGSILSGRILVRVGYRRTTCTGALLMATASAALGYGALGDLWEPLVAAEFLLGLGMGGVANTALIVVQNHSSAGELGTMTGLVHLGRSIGAAIGVNCLAAAIAWMTAKKGIDSFGLLFAGNEAGAYSIALFSMVPVAAIAGIASMKLPGRYSKYRNPAPNSDQCPANQSASEPI